MTLCNSIKNACTVLAEFSLRRVTEIEHAGMNGQGDEIGKTASNSTSPKSARGGGGGSAFSQDGGALLLLLVPRPACR